MPLKCSQHAWERMLERSISWDFIQATVNSGNYVLQPHGNRKYQAIYNYVATAPVFDQRGFPVVNPLGMPLYYSYITNQLLVTVITDPEGTKVVTVWWN